MLTLVAACIRCHIFDICSKGKCVVTNFDDRIQHSLWHYFVAIPLLGRNDYISRNDYADGDMVNHNMDQESVRER